MRNLKPILNDGEYIFCSISDKFGIQIQDPVMIFYESEGKTMIIKKQQAEEFGITYQKIFSWITLTMYSSLETVGLTAAFSKALTEEEISCNVVAAFHHDHLFVPFEQRDKALEILRRLL
ncbi:MAG: ACT domain-containing protein [Balneola sp.]